MDQSLRTVATQLLNSTNKGEDLVRMSDPKIETLDETPMHVVHVSTRVEDAISDHRRDEEESTTKMKFGIPVNSKFGHFEITNPGHAMAITEEEYEKEMASAATANAALKNHPTTASMLSTWIQLYPPVTTTEGNNNELETKADFQSNQIPTTTSTKLPTSIFKQNTANIKPVKKVEAKPTTVLVVKSTEPTTTSTSKEFKTQSTSETPNYSRISSTLPTTLFENNIEETETTTEKKVQTQRTTVDVSTTTKPTQPQKKSPTKVSTTPKSRITAPKNSTSKPQASKASNKAKPATTRRPSLTKNDTVTSTSRIEKVTFRPISTTLQSTERPQFITKIKASVLTDNNNNNIQKTTTIAPTTMKSINSILSKANFSNLEPSSPKVPNPTRVNNVLKVHTKKPIDDSTKIEIQPIRVNPPVLTIQKFAEDDDVPNTKVDIKYEYKDVETNKPTTETPSTTTKKPKRKKNKRRRKPSTSTTLAPSASSNYDESTTINNLQLDIGSQNAVQESKIEPESKEKPSKKKKQSSQNTQIQNKPFGTQIYNFLSREVMPSVGVMSLVGLGLGLASYFLYPFGGVIARRNYDVDQQNYKYNLDEYGGTHGFSEEEVLSKVYSGMTPTQHHQSKIGYGPTGEKNPNYYKYGVDQSQAVTRYTSATKSIPNRIIYRPVESTPYDSSYQKTDVKYSEIPTTPSYYDRARQPQQSADFMPNMNKPGLGNNRQFVVGNIPKEYSSIEVDKISDMTIQGKMDQINQPSVQYQSSDSYNIPMQAKEDFDIPVQAKENYDAMMQHSDIYNSPMDGSQGTALETIGSPAALVSNVNEEQVPIYEQAEISSISGGIEHGPRSLKFETNRQKRSILQDITGKLLPELTIPVFKSQRSERSSVIQEIPSKAELEKERKEQEEEEDLSNEILDIIDDTLPGHEEDKKKRHKELKEQLMKEHQQNEAKGTTEKASSTESTSTTTKQVETSTTTTTTTPAADSTTTSTTQSTPTELNDLNKDQTTLDWFDSDNTSTTEKPKPQGIDIVGFAKRVAEFKLRLGLTILKHASEGLAKYIGNIQKRFNGEE